ncbi:hypothetical protein MAR_037020 [Mya arenaria]|uniref:EGF-like domain-containing protein n=1 Tax=Mya arenaria TaxID=6604 RepID=A0ABY7FVZ3_MYAAR|nr:hypothetical protein MAR_037020 [Mya arenaria]
MTCYGPCNPNVFCEGATGIPHCTTCLEGWIGDKCDKDENECTAHTYTDRDSKKDETDDTVEPAESKHKVKAWSLFTMNSCPSEETSLTYMASGPSHPPYTFSSSPLSPFSSDIVPTRCQSHSAPFLSCEGKYSSNKKCTIDRLKHTLIRQGASLTVLPSSPARENTLPIRKVQHILIRQRAYRTVLTIFTTCMG